MENEKEARLKKLQEYIEGPFFMAHELPLDDPEFDERVARLHGLVHSLEAAAGLRITLFENNVLTNDPCAICGARCDPNGFDYGIEKRLVCDQCAEKEAPELVDIRKAALAYAEREAAALASLIGDRVRQTFNESPETRVMRVIDEFIPF